MSGGDPISILGEAKDFIDEKIGLDVDRLSWRSEEPITVADVSEVKQPVLYICIVLYKNLLLLFTFYCLYDQ